MRHILIAALLAAAPAMALAQELPQFPKIAPPEPLPDAICDTAKPNDGQWLVGRWVAPQSRWEFTRSGSGITWTLDRKGSANSDFGWQDGTQIDGIADKVTGCTVHLTAGKGAFQFDGVLTEGGKLFGFATNRKGENVRFTLRRER
ncbi:MAG: hypothetical protein H7Z12_05670 [Rhodospirillaceae bacterium]|nr:hypothetical protein [Rhodospirillales bacterium]